MEKPQRKTRRWTAFSLRGLLLLVLVIAVWLGWTVNKARKQREAVAAIRKFGGWVHYDHEFVNGPINVPQGNGLWQTSWGKLTPDRKPRATNWLRRLLGDDYFQEIAHVSLFVDLDKRMTSEERDDLGSAKDALTKLATQAHVRSLHVGNHPINDKDLAQVGNLTSLEELIVFPGRDLTDEGIAHLAGLTNLRVLWLTGTKMTDAGLRSLDRMTNLEHLMIEGQGFSDSGVQRLRGMTQLKTFSLGRGKHTMTDASVEALSGMTKLEELDLSEWPITDASVETLCRFKNLKSLGLSGTKISEKGRQRLKQALPALKIE